MDFFGGVVRKVLEFHFLRENSAAWVDSSKVYLRENQLALERLGTFCRTDTERKEQDTTSEHARDTPLLRRSGKRQRHECYRLCLEARIDAANYFKSASDTLLKGAPHRWDKIRRSLTDAESILNRSGGPADRQAMAITRLTAAELHVRRAELLRWALDEILETEKTATDQERHCSKMSPDKLESRLDCEKALEEAFATLSTVEQLMNEGRGENRWRFFYQLTLARAHLLRAYIWRQSARRTALTHMTWCARHLTGALNNCGLWTDRYDVLLWWWDVWKEVAWQFYEGSNDAAQQDHDYMSTMYARLGVRWGKEPSGSRLTRFSSGSGTLS